MARQYNRVKLWGDTLKNFKMKKMKIDTDLKNLGIKKTITLTKVFHLASMKPIFLGEQDLIEISKKKRKFRV